MQKFSCEICIPSFWNSFERGWHTEPQTFRLTAQVFKKLELFYVRCSAGERLQQRTTRRTAADCSRHTIQRLSSTSPFKGVEPYKVYSGASRENGKAGKLSLRKSHLGKSKGVQVEAGVDPSKHSFPASNFPSGEMGSGSPPFPKILNKLEPKCKVSGALALMSWVMSDQKLTLSVCFVLGAQMLLLLLLLLLVWLS